MVATSEAATVAMFTDGNGTSFVDQYPGRAGSGWATAWTRTGAPQPSGYPHVDNTDPLGSGGNYLANRLTKIGDGNRTRTAHFRQYSTYDEVDLTLPHTGVGRSMPRF